MCNDADAAMTAGATSGLALAALVDNRCGS